jgi:hypothetical protein
MSIALWRTVADEEMLSTVWRLATYTGPIRAELIPLDLISPQPEDDEAELAQEARDTIGAALGFAP